MAKSGIAFLFSLLVIASCTESDVTPLPDGRNYYPLEVGRWLEYRLDSIIFDDIQGGNVQDTFSGFVREVVADKFEGLTGDTLYLIERSFRRLETDPWVVTNAFTESSDASFGYRQEGNLTQIKMKFPLRDDTRWDPTTFIDPSIEVQIGTELVEMFSNWNGLVVSLDSSEVVGGFGFDKVLTCQQANDDNGVERRFVMEKYVKDIGLVLRVDSILDSRCKRLGELLPCLESDGSGNLVLQPWVEHAEKGYILRQEIIRYK